MSNERFASIWDALEDTPQAAENMKLRSDLHLKQTGLTQTEAARLLGVTQPRISDLLRGKIDLFSLDALVNMAAAAGLRLELRARDAA